MLYLDLSPITTQGSADFEFNSDSLELWPLDVKNLQDWDIPQLGQPVAWGFYMPSGPNLCLQDDYCQQYIKSTIV